MTESTNPELRYRSFWLLIGYALVALVVTLSLTSDPRIVELSFPYQDKVYHAIAYFTLMFWFGQIYHDRSWKFFFAICFVLLGVLMEYLQSFDPARFSEFSDFVANTVGVILGLLFLLGSARYILVRVEELIRGSLR